MPALKSSCHRNHSSIRISKALCRCLLIVLPLLLLKPALAWDDRELLVSAGLADYLLPVTQVDGLVGVELLELVAATGCSHYRTGGFHYLLPGRLEIKLQPDSHFMSRDGRVEQVAAPLRLRQDKLWLPLSLLARIAAPVSLWRYDAARRELVVRQGRGISGFSLEELPEGLLARVYLDSIPAYAGDADGHTARLRFDREAAFEVNLPDVIHHPALSGFTVTREAATLQVAFQFSADYSLLDIFESDDNRRINLLFGSGEIAPVTADLQPWTPPAGWRLDTIIIDPGHGGRDPGAVSPWGMYEKTVNLEIGLELRRLLRRDGRFQIFMTRDDDRFLSLKERTRFANRYAGKLFISIHCNTARNRSARGFETFLLRTARNEYALNVALKENAVVKLENAPQEYDAMRTDNFILMSMAQAAFVQESAQFALQLKPHLAELIRPHSGGINQAGFYVLWGASMPAVLLEMGYLTNQRDHRLLKSDNGRKQLAHAIYNGILDFKRQYENN